MSKTNAMRVLVVDDSVILRERVVKMFSAIAGVKVVGQASSVKAATAMVHVTHPDVVILDIEMPDGSGINLLRDLKRDYPATVVIMLTNHAEPRYRSKCFELKADYFLSKSTDSKLLVEIGEQLVRAKGHHPDE